MKTISPFTGLVGAAILATAIAILALTGPQPPSRLASPQLSASKSRTADCRDCVRPPRATSWRYQLQGSPRSPFKPAIYVIDGVETSSRTVRAISRAGGYPVCYVNAGAWEQWRPDSGRFEQRLLGDSDGWPGERYLDIRERAALMPIMSDRFKDCRRKGFKAVEADNVDAYENASGFPLDAADQLAYNRSLARAAHRLGLAIALKNDLSQTRQLAASFDFAIVEQCVEMNECKLIRPFTRRHKPVLVVEYSVSYRRLCSAASRYGFSGLLQNLELDRPGRPCPRPR